MVVLGGSFVKTKHDNEVNQMKRYEKEQVRALLLARFTAFTAFTASPCVCACRAIGC